MSGDEDGGRPPGRRPVDQARHDAARAPRLVKTSEFAKALGYDARTVKRWVDKGEIVPDVVTPGGHMRWDLDRRYNELMPRERLYSTAELAKEFGFGVSSIRKWVAQKKLVPDLVTPHGYFRWNLRRLDREFTPLAYRCAVRGYRPPA